MRIDYEKLALSLLSVDFLGPLPCIIPALLPLVIKARAVVPYTFL